MARSEELNYVQKRFIVQRLACFLTPTATAKAFKEEFGIEIARNRVSYYDPGTKAGAALDPALKAIFDETRAGFLKKIDAVPIYHQAYRLMGWQRIYEIAEGRGQLVEMRAALEGGSKEANGASTNEPRHRPSGPNGERAPAPGTVIIMPDNGRGEVDWSEQVEKLHQYAAAQSEADKA